MPLTDKAVLYLNTGDFEVEFHIENSFTLRQELSKEFLLGASRGQLVSELISLAGGDEGADAVGYNIDLGLGSTTIEITAELGPTQDGAWGLVDGQAGPEIYDNSKTESAHDGDPLERAQIMKKTFRKARTGSFRDTLFVYAGQWSDGTYAGTAGRFGEPIPAAIQEISLSKEEDNPSTAGLTITMLRTENVEPKDIPDILRLD